MVPVNVRSDNAQTYECALSQVLAQESWYK